MKKMPTSSVSKLLPLFTLLEKHKVDVPAFLKECGIAPDIARQPDERLPLEMISALNEKASRLTGDDFIGLHQGEIFTGLSNILGYVLINCRDMAEVIEKAIKYQKICDEGRTFIYQIAGKQVTLQFKFEDNRLQNDRHLMEQMMMGIVTYSRILTGKDIHCREVHFLHAKPCDTSEYERLFGCQPHFNSCRNALVFDRSYLSLPILQPNRELLGVLEGYAREVLSRLQADDTLTSKVRKLIVDTLRGENPTIGMIASRVNMSIRNLQLKLKEEEMTYSSLLAEGRKELAQAYLKDRNVPIAEIAYLLGFSEPSVFHRTFKRWTGTTPGMYRNQCKPEMQ